jgi:hypothetical protein
MRLSDIINKQKQKDKEAFDNSPDKDVNYYYEEKKKRIEQGIEEELIINEEEEED